MEISDFTSLISLIFWLILPFLAWRFRLRLSHGPMVAFRAFVLAVVGGSLVWFAQLWIIEWELKHAWDPDGNSELDDPTPENMAKMERWSSDAGRMMAPMFPIPVTFVWAALNFGVFTAATNIRAKLFPPKPG